MDTSMGHEHAAALSPARRGSGLLSQPLYLPDQAQILSKQLGDRPGSPHDIEPPPAQDWLVLTCLQAA